METKEQCNGITRKKTRCKNTSIKNSQFCHYHISEKRKIRNFFRNHNESIVSFLAGATADPIVSDIYNYIKQQLKMEYLVPLVPEDKQSEIINNWKNNRNSENLYKLLPCISIGQSLSAVIDILGKPDNKIWRADPGNEKKYSREGDYIAYVTVPKGKQRVYVILMFSFPDKKLESIKFIIENDDYYDHEAFDWMPLHGLIPIYKR